jgi:hypothetical protein
MNDIVSLADFSCVADCANGMTGTDNTANIQAAINATPAGGALYVPGNGAQGGDGPGYGFASTLTVNRPINIFGRGMYSRLVPLSGFNAATPNIHLVENDYYWGGIKWSDFLIGTSWFNPPFSRYGGEGIFVDAISIPKMRWKGLMIGESGNGYSFHLTGAGTQHHVIDECMIHGGIHLDAIADGHSITGCDIGGRSLYSGILAYMPGAGSLKIIGNPSITAVGGTVIQGVSMPIFADNYCEELPGFPTNNYNNSGGQNGMLTLVGYPGNVYAARVVRNIFNMGVSPAGNGFNVPGATGYCVNINPAVSGVVNTHINDNEFNISTTRGYINSGDPNMALGPNTYVQPSWLKLSGGSASPSQTYGGG